MQIIRDICKEIENLEPSSAGRFPVGQEVYRGYGALGGFTSAKGKELAAISLHSLGCNSHFQDIASPLVKHFLCSAVMDDLADRWALPISTHLEVDSDAQGFLDQHPFVLPSIRSGLAKIHSLSGNLEIWACASVFTDVEDGHQHLTVIVRTTQSTSATRKMLRDFGSLWWPHQPNEMHDFLAFRAGFN
jgi:hypothetical protein